MKYGISAVHFHPADADFNWEINAYADDAPIGYQLPERFVVEIERVSDQYWRAMNAIEELQALSDDPRYGRGADQAAVDAIVAKFLGDDK